MKAKVNALFAPRSINEMAIDRLYHAYPFETYGFLFSQSNGRFYIHTDKDRKEQYHGGLLEVIEWLKIHT